ncbi:MAG: ABC transporter permease [Bacillota bacterium]
MRVVLSKAQEMYQQIVKDKYLYLLLAPMVLWYIIFLYKPMYGLQIAFKDFSIFKGIENSPWVGLENFKTFFKSHYFLRNLKNTLLINIYSLIIGFPIPIILALMINEVKNSIFKKTVQTLTYLPHFISVVVVAGIVTNFLAPTNGLLNLLIEKLGGEKIYFLMEAKYFRTVFISMNLWKEAGFQSIVYLAALSGINPQLYEAAVMDGASKWKQLWHVTIPGIMPTIVIMLIIRIGSLLEVGYESIILLYKPSTYETADVLSTYVYRAGLETAQYDLAAAVGLFNAVVAFILVIGANRLSKKFTESGLW